MDLDEFRTILSNSRLNIWETIDAAITVASTDYSGELKRRRDGIVEKIYAQQQQCRNCDLNVEQPNGGLRTITNDGVGGGGGESPLSSQSIPQDDEEDEEQDPYGGLFDDEQTKILTIKEQLEDPNQTEDSVVELLQTLADMDLTFKGLKETDIGRHVNRLRKHPSNEVRSLVKHLVSKWKELVDDWVGSSNNGIQSSSLTDGDSPLLQNVPRKPQNGHQRGPDIGYSPNPHNWSPEHKPKTSISKMPSKPVSQSYPSMAASASAPQNRPHKEQSIDLDRLASARKRLQANYQEAQNAKKQRTIQVMDIHEIPKPKNGFIAKNKGNFHGRNHR